VLNQSYACRELVGVNMPSNSLSLCHRLVQEGSLEFWHMSQGYELIQAVSRHRGEVAWARIAGKVGKRLFGQN